MHCDISGFGGTHSYCSQLVGEVTSVEQMALLGVPSSRFAVPVSDTDEVALCESAAPGIRKRQQSGEFQSGVSGLHRGLRVSQPMDSELFQLQHHCWRCLQ